MVDGLFLCATFTGRRGGHTLYVQAGAETSDTSAEAVKPDPRCSWESHSGGVGAGVGDEVTKSRKVVQPLRLPLVIPQCAARMLLSDELMRCCAAGTNGCLDLRGSAFVLCGRVSTVWSKCPGSTARRARESVAPLRRSSVGWMPARIGRLPAGVRRRHPVTIRKASLMTVLMRWAWALWHQTGAQYSAVEWTRARVAFRSIALAPQPEPASRLKSATCAVNFLRSISRCRRNVSDLSNVSPTHLGSEQRDRVSSLWLAFSSRLASLLLRWKTADTVFVLLSFSFQVWRHSYTVAMSLLSTPSPAYQSPSACMIARSSAYTYFLETVVGRSEMQMLKRKRRTLRDAVLEAS